MATCATCGAVSEDDVPPLTWTSSLERGVLRHRCERCSREHLRSMEARLDPEWW